MGSETSRIAGTASEKTGGVSDPFAIECVDSGVPALRYCDVLLVPSIGEFGMAIMCTGDCVWSHHELGVLHNPRSAPPAAVPAPTCERWGRDPLALFFPAPFHLLRQGHLGHHRRNRSDDEVFDLYSERDIFTWKVVAWYGILLGLYWVIVALSNVVLIFGPVLMNPKVWKWDRAATVFLSHFSPQSFRIMQVEALAAITLHCTIVMLLGVPWYTYALMYFGFGWMWSSLQYVHHYQAERDVLNGAFNLVTWAPLDLVWLNRQLAPDSSPTTDGSMGVLAPDCSRSWSKELLSDESIFSNVARPPANG